MAPMTLFNFDTSTDPNMFTLTGISRSALNCIYWGFVVATILLGVTLIQGFIYFKNYDDKRPLRFLVTTLIIMDVLSSCLTAHVLYFYLIENYGNTASLEKPAPPTFTIEYLFTSIVTFLSQLFYGFQIYKLHRHSFWCIIPSAAMVFLSLTAFISNIASTALILNVNYFAATISISLLKVFTSLGNCCATASDLIACTALCLFLASHRADLGRGHTTLVDTLLFYTINRGVLFSVAQLGRMIAYLSAPAMLYWVPFHFCLSKLHVNSLLMLLNSRQALRGVAQEVSKIDFRMDPTSAVPRAAQTSPTVLRPIELHHLADGLSIEDDAKFSPSSQETNDHSDRSSRVVFLNDQEAQ